MKILSVNQLKGINGKNGYNALIQEKGDRLGISEILCGKTPKGTYFYKESPIVNEEIQKIAQNHSLLYVSLDEITNYPSIFFKPNSYELNYKGHELIFNLIKEKLNTTCNT